MLILPSCLVAYLPPLGWLIKEQRQRLCGVDLFFLPHHTRDSFDNEPSVPRVGLLIRRAKIKLFPALTMLHIMQFVTRCIIHPLIKSVVSQRVTANEITPSENKMQTYVVSLTTMSGIALYT